MKFPLKTQVALFITLIILVVSIISTCLFISSYSHSIEREIISRGSTLSISLAKAAAEGLAIEDLDLLRKAAYIVKADDVELAQVYSSLWQAVDSFPLEKINEPPDPRAVEHFKIANTSFYIKHHSRYIFYSPILFKPLDELPGVTIGFTKITLSSHAMQQTAERAIIVNIALSALITLLSIAAINILINRLVIRPVMGLHNSIKMLGKGDLPDIVPTGAAVEIRALAVEFNNMGCAITERKRAEEALRTIEERLSLALKAAGQSIYDSDLKTGETIVSPEYALMLGYAPAEFHETTAKWIKKLHPDDKKQVNAVYRAYSKGEIPEYKVEFRLKTKDGGWKWILSLGKIIERDPDGTPLRMIGTYTDITEHKEAEEALRKEKIFSDTVINSMPGIFYLFDEDGRFILWNRNFEIVSGYSAEEMRKANPLDFFLGEEKKLVGEAIQEAFVSGASKVEANFISKNGRRTPYYFTGFRFLWDKRTYLVGTGIDMTERNQAEDKYRTLFEESKDAVYISTPEGRGLDINRAGVELFGYSSKEELFAVDIANDLYFNPEDRKSYQEMLNKQGFVKDYEIQMKRKDGKKLTILSTSSVVKDEQGAIKAYRGILRDVTEHKDLEQQFLQSQKMEAVGQLAGGIAHDFNNLLTGIIGYSELELMKLPEDTATARNIKIVKDAGEKAASLVKQILAFSRKQVLEMTIVNLNTIVEDMGKLLTRTIGENILLQLNIKTKVDNIMADSGQIGQILLNLAVNARDAMPSGGRLTIETADVYLDEDFVNNRQGVAAGNYVLLSVTDTGHGMSREMQDKIFEPFFTTKESGKGTGLGLSTVYGIVQQHNGYIWLYSEEGKGSTFRIYLPAVKGETKEAEKPASIIASGTETVLVVDDEPDIRRFVFDVLQPLGYKVLEASSGEEAMEIGERVKGEIDLLLTDFTMPGMNGLRLRESFLKKRPGIKVIVMSGYGDEAITHTPIEKDDIVFMQKPLTYRKLATKLRDVLDSK